MSKNIIVCGAGGFIGSHLVRKLKAEGHSVLGVDLKYPEFSAVETKDFLLYDLRNYRRCKDIFEKKHWMDHPYDEVYQLAADMGGAGFVFTGSNDADIMHNSGLINLNVAKSCVTHKIKKVFYSSSACIYPERNQLDPDNPNCAEDSAYPADPDSDYGWEKIFSERLYAAFHRNYGLDIRVARFHNIFGPEGTWEGGREKAPAALCRKAAEARDGGSIDVWGDGEQTRSFLYIDECLEGVQRLMESDHREPINIGSEEMISINNLAKMAIDISGKDISIQNIPGPEGVRGRNSDNKLIGETLGWKPSCALYDGIKKTYTWIEQQVNAS